MTSTLLFFKACINCQQLLVLRKIIIKRIKNINMYIVKKYNTLVIPKRKSALCIQLTYFNKQSALYCKKSLIPNPRLSFSLMKRFTVLATKQRKNMQNVTECRKMRAKKALTKWLMFGPKYIRIHHAVTKLMLENCHKGINIFWCLC